MTVPNDWAEAIDPYFDGKPTGLFTKDRHVASVSQRENNADLTRRRHQY